MGMFDWLTGGGSPSSKPVIQNSVVEQFRGELARHRRENDLQLFLQRLGSVLGSFLVLQDQEKVVLADAVAIYLFANLADHPEEVDCFSSLSAWTDILFEANKEVPYGTRPGESAVYLEAAHERLNALSPSIDRILPESSARLRSQPEGSVLHEMGNVIHNVRQIYLPFVPVLLLRDLTHSMISTAVAIRNEGGASSVTTQKENVMESLLQTRRVLNMAIKAVHSDIDCGKLEVRDGTIHRVS